VNSPIRTSAIGLLQHLQLLYLPSELDIHQQNTTSYLTLLLHAVSPCDTNMGRSMSSWVDPSEVKLRYAEVTLKEKEEAGYRGLGC
jgi:hypothetical protein